MVLNNGESNYSTHVVEGLWMNNPSGYKQAKNYHGFQKSNMTSSISVKVVHEPLYIIKNRFNENNQKANKWEIIQMNPVKINNLDSCFYIEYLDKRKQFEKFDLIMRDESNNKTFYITSFKKIGDDSVDGESIKTTVLSSYLGKVIEKEELFKMASFDKEINGVIYTKDGKYPTESEGNGVMKVFSKTYRNETQIESYVVSIAKKTTGKDYYSKRVQSLGNGKIFTYEFNTSEKKYMYIIVFFDQKESIVLSYNCDSSEDTGDYFDYAQGKLIKMIPQ